MKKFFFLLSLSVLTLSLVMCRKAVPFAEEDYDERLTGGWATVFDETSKAFSHAVDGLTGRDLRMHELGDASFEQTFVSAPSPVNNGLGPIFNNVSCISCHHNDGKGIPTVATPTSSLLFRISTNGRDAFGGPVPVAGYGNQIQDLSIFGKIPEAKVDIRYEEFTVAYADGEQVSLRKPVYELRQTYSTISGTYALSPRLAPPVFGLGLLENIPESTLIYYADEQDADGDGISGKINYVYNPETKRREPGRFGLKANTPTLRVQVAGAYHQDMGITNAVFPVESSWQQPQLDALNDDPELPDSLLHAVVFYVQTLAVPARRNVADPVVKQGKLLFAQAKCSGCHIPEMETGVNLQIPQLSHQRIQPYTDLLLHDMGEGLADGYNDFLANGKEWKTLPLWGIGLFEKTNGTPYYLHDGRARSLEEAILWHGGEAEQSKNAFLKMSRAERNALIRFVRSL